MAQETLPAPPEAELIKRARMAAGLTIPEAVARVRSAGGKISESYWQAVERGYGGRRSERVPARASEGLLAQMAHAVGVTPDQLREAGRGDAAGVLEEIRRRAPRLERGEGDIFPEEVMRQLAPGAQPDFREIAGRVEAAAAAHGVDLAGPRARLQGSWVFPSDRASAVKWDFMTSEGMSPWQVVQGMAVIRYVERAPGRVQADGRTAAG